MTKAASTPGNGGSVVIDMAGFEAMRRRHVGLDAVTQDLMAEARKGLELQAAAVARLTQRLDAGFAKALDILSRCRGRIVVCGIGKSGLIGRKLASTFACTGSPSAFLHPAEALHGDLGMLTADDVVLFVCYSGETPEVMRILPYMRSVAVPSIALVGVVNSTLGRFADVAIDVSVEREACPLNLAPTTSALASLAMGDALALSLMRLRGFSSEDFARFHPGGSLGRRFTRVVDVMHKEELPFVLPTTTVGEALLVMSHGRRGLAIVVDDADKLCGVVTDGDLRRALARRGDLLDREISEIMTQTPVTISENAPVAEAEERMQSLRLKALIALDVEGRVSGVIEVFK
jgi:arabinose-5-phosphate isomerase